MTFARYRRRLLTAAALTFVPALAAAQALPPAAELMAAYTKAIGGEATYARIEGMHASGSFAVPSMGLSANFDMYSARPNRMLMVSSLPGVGEIRQGYDGTTAWAIDPMQGARILEGNELKAISDEANFENSLRLARNFTSVQTVEKTKLGDKECYKVKLVWKSGRESFDCYGTTDGLLVGSISMQETAMGAVETTTLLSDYKEFGGMKLPTRTTVQAMGMEQLMTIEKVEFGAPEAAKFELPAEIKALKK